MIIQNILKQYGEWDTKLEDKNISMYKADYSQLKSKLFFQLLGMGMIACVLIIIIYKLIWSEKGGNYVVSVFQRFFRLDYFDSLSLYQNIFRNNREIIWLIAIAVMFFLLLRIAINWFVKYFDITIKGITSILADEDEIYLPPEMSAIEQKLNLVKRTIKQQKNEMLLEEQRKNDLIMYLAHDIRTPLTSVIGYLNLIDEAPDMPQNQREKYIHITLDKAYRLEKMVNEFFEITRYNLQQITITKEKIDLFYLFVQLTDELSPILHHDNNTITLNLEDNLTICGDPDKLARAFNNILKNAVSYSYPNTEIKISAVESENKITIVFENKGPTIPKEKLSEIFEKFYRLDQARATNTGGSGLGLSIAKEIVKLHGGVITADSENDTTKFTITLPVLSK